MHGPWHPGGSGEERPVVIDVEASGFGGGSYPIEIGLADQHGKTHCFLIRPEPGWTHWDPQAAETHGIPRSVLLVHGRSIRHVAEQLNQLLWGRTVYSDAWGNDISWLGMLFEEAERTQRFRVETLTRIMTPVQQAGWAQAKQDVIDRLQLTRHRASTDALILQETFMSTRAAEPMIDPDAHSRPSV